MALLARYLGGDAAPPYHDIFRVFGVFRGFIFVLFAFFAATPAFSQIQQSWVARYNNGLSNGNHQAIKMALDANGNIYITGPSQNTNGQLGYATIKYAPSGTQLWAARYDSTNSPFAMPTNLAVDVSNNVVDTGNAITVRYDTNGNQLWTAPYAGSDIAVDINCNVFVTGLGTSFGTVKLNSGGSNVWMNTVTDPYGLAISQKIAVGAAGDAYVAGSSAIYRYRGLTNYWLEMIKCDPNGNTLWDVDYEMDGYYRRVEDVVLDGSDNLYLIANGYEQTFLTLKYSSNGSEVWAAFNPTSNGASSVSGLVVDSHSNVIVTAANEHTPTPHGAYGTYRIGTNGSYIWTNLYSQTPTGGSAGTAITSDQANSVYVTGYSPGPNSSNNIVTIKYDSNGNQIWLESYSGPNNGSAAANAIAVDANGNVYVAGYETVTGGGTEMVLIRYSPIPTVQRQSNGTIQLHTSGNPGQTFDFQASTNLQSWLDLGTTNADTNGCVLFTDTNASHFIYRFYLTTPE